MNSRVLKKKLFNFFSPMDGGSIPQQDHGPPEMFEQFFKEKPNIQTGEMQFDERWAGMLGYSPEEIASSVYPGLTLAQVYSALAYFEDHREEIDRLFQEESRFVEEFRRQNPHLVREPPARKD